MRAFLARYLSENGASKKIKADFLVAAPHIEKFEHSMADFSLKGRAKARISLEKLSEQGGQIFLYHSKDDDVVSFSNFEAYKKELPKARATVFTDRQHFNQPTFPKIIEDIKSLK